MLLVTFHICRSTNLYYLKPLLVILVYCDQLYCRGAYLLHSIYLSRNQFEVLNSDDDNVNDTDKRPTSYFICDYNNYYNKS